jgi:hypothetical protein
MPSFLDYPASPSTKLIYLGHSGAGKTGSLVSLATAGYRVRLLDLDNKAEILRDYLFNNSPKNIYSKERPSLWTAEQARTRASRLSFVTCTESFNILGVKAVPRGDSWQKINQHLNDWRDGDDKPGNLSKWLPTDVLVIDSFSRLCEAAMNFQLSLNNRLATGPRVGATSDNDYTAAYRLITDFLQLLKSSEIKCNVILICHIVFMEEPSGNSRQNTVTRTAKGFPQVFGRSMISPTVTQYFSHAIRAKSAGSEPAVKRTIVTNNDENVELINTAPLRVPREYALETGLAEYFRDIRSTQPATAKEAAQ